MPAPAPRLAALPADRLLLASTACEGSSTGDLALFMQGGAPAKAVKAARPVATAAVSSSSTLASLLKALLPILVVLAAAYYWQLTQQG